MERLRMQRRVTTHSLRYFCLLIGLILLALGVRSAVAETWISANGASAAPSTAVVQWYDESGLDLTVTTAGVDLSYEKTEQGDFVVVGWPGSVPAGEPGEPGLPVVRRLFSVPAGAAVTLSEQMGKTVQVDLASAGFSGRVMPFQSPPPAIVEQDYVREFEFDKRAYARDVTSPQERVTMTRLGIARGMDLYLLEVRPVAYNPVAGTLEIWPQVDVSLRFEGGEMPAPALRATGPFTKSVLNPPKTTKQDRGAPRLLIVAASDFSSSAPLSEFIALKLSLGFEVLLYTATVGATPETIKTYISAQYGSLNPPDYLLLVGDAFWFDTTAASNTIPIWETHGEEQWATDLPYVCMDGGDDWFADMPFARWPVRTLSELQAVVDKTIMVESGPYPDPTYTGRAVFVAGSDLEAEAERIHDEVIDTYMTPNGMQSERVYYLDGADTQDVADALNAGCSLAVYYGHCGINYGWNTPPFTLADVAALNNTGAYPFVLSFCCLPSQFVGLDANDPGVHEQWMRVSNRGASATYGSMVGVHEWYAWEDLYKLYMNAIYTDGIRELGPAANATMEAFITLYGASSFTRDYAETFELFADPSMRLPQPGEGQRKYLVVAAEDYVGTAALNQFIASKTARGFDVMTYSVPSGTTPATIKAYIQALWGTTNQPEFVLLVGDTNGTSASTSSRIPHWVGGGSKNAPTDIPYVCLDDSIEWYPDIPIGRFSVQNVSQLQAVVDKTLTVESGDFPDPDYVRRGAFLANPDTAGLAEPTHEWVITKYFEPRGYVPTRIYGAEGGDTQDVADAVNAGSMFTVYMGHSSSSGWWDPSFTQSDVNSLTNEGLYGLVFGWSCNTNNFTQSECCGETWHRAANKGAAVYISASTYIYWGSYDDWIMSSIHEKSFFSAIFGLDFWEVGRAWQEGLFLFLKDYGGWDGNFSHQPTQHLDICRNFFEEFVVLGDPSLRLPEPNTFTLSAAPAMMELCCPPATQAQFTINVGLLGEFEEAVTLSLSGGPVGASVNFSQNGLVPPFTSVLTLGNLDSVPAGDYTLIIQGVSATKQRSTSAQLSISSGSPAAPTLLTPTDGASGVDLRPVLTWEELADAVSYDVQIATDVGFTNVVYSASSTTATHTVTSPLGMLAAYFWRVRASNSCGESDYSEPFSFMTVNRVMPVSYDMLNGETGTYTYFDDIYDGDGDPTVALSPLSNGLGELVDGVIATQNWNQNNVPYVGWHTVEPTITWHFAESLDIDMVTLHLDDSNGSGGVYPPTHVSLTMGGTTLRFPVTDPSGGEPFAVSFSELGLSGDTLEMFLEEEISPASRYMMLSEVEFYGSGHIGACCVDGVCTVGTESSCTAAGGTYLGDDTDCTPNPCAMYEPSCLIISEVVEASASGNCPKWIEIMNTGLSDYTFLEGGVIIQTDSDTDVTVDVDLTGVTIEAGQAFILNGNHGGVCTGGFMGQYGFAPDLSSEAYFGDGNDRYILTDTADGSHLLDIYGEFGVDGDGLPWNYSRGYSYRLPSINTGNGGVFDPSEWFLGGTDSLWGADPYTLVMTLTTPGVHQVDERCGNAGDMNCDGVRNGMDVDAFLMAVLDPAGYAAAEYDCILHGDFDKNGVVDVDDISGFADALAQD